MGEAAPRCRKGRDFLFFKNRFWDLYLSAKRKREEGDFGFYYGSFEMRKDKSEKEMKNKEFGSLMI